MCVEHKNHKCEDQTEPTMVPLTSHLNSVRYACLNPYWQISGIFLRPFYWKTHPDQILHIIYGFSQKIRMDEFSNKTACETTQNSPNDDWMSFPVKRSSSRPGFKKLVLMIFWWMSFPVKRSQKFPSHLPIRVKVSKSILGELRWFQTFLLLPVRFVYRKWSFFWKYIQSLVFLYYLLSWCQKFLESIYGSRIWIVDFSCLK